jgi:tRNA threonylcarbamoyladenosine biosynthesis protein TsaB
MLMLAVDTSGRQGGITLARGDNHNFEVIESASIEGGTFSAELIPQISDLLRRHYLIAKDLHGVVAVTGPGSFTGLRVGLTAVKGLSEVLQIPVAAVTSLELLLAATESAQMAAIDAGRNEVYVAWQKAGERQEGLLPFADAVESAKSQNLRVVTSDANLAARFANSELVSFCGSEIAAQIGLKKLFSGETTDVLALDANYIRKSEAEYMQKLKRV